MGDLKESSSSYLNEFLNNLGKSLGVEDNQLEDAQETVEYIVGNETKGGDSEIEGLVDEYFEAKNEDKRIDPRLNVIQKVGLFKNAQSWKEVASEVGKNVNNVRKEILWIQVIGAGIFISIGSEVPGAAAVGSILIKKGLDNTEYIKKIIKLEDIEKILGGL